jgi:hypothetical protein
MPSERDPTAAEPQGTTGRLLNLILIDDLQHPTKVRAEGEWRTLSEEQRSRVVELVAHSHGHLTKLTEPTPGLLDPRGCPLTSAASASKGYPEAERWLQWQQLDCLRLNQPLFVLHGAVAEQLYLPRFDATLASALRCDAIPLLFEGRPIGLLDIDPPGPSRLTPGEHRDPTRPVREAASPASSSDPADPPVDPPSDPDLEGPLIPVHPSGPLLYVDAATWVVIAAFAGMALAWATALTPAWAGLLIGGGIAFLIAVGITSRG